MPEQQYVPVPVRPFRIFALAWLMSRAFSSNSVMAVLAFPLALLTLVPYATRRQLYETQDRNGMVVFGRLSTVTDVAILIVLILPVCILLGFVISAVDPVPALVIGLVVLILFIFGLIGLSDGVPNTKLVDRTTPKGPRIQVAALAQRPGTRLSALQLALQLRDSAPSGSVLVAVAANDRLLHGYQRLEFSRGTARRVHWAAP